jgi:hypothetical protein
MKKYYNLVAVVLGLIISVNNQAATIQLAAAFAATSTPQIRTTTALSGNIYFVSNPNSATFGSSLSSSRLYGTLYFSGGSSTGELVKRSPTGSSTIEAIYFDADSGSDYLLVLSNTSSYGPNISSINSSANNSGIATDLGRATFLL